MGRRCDVLRALPAALLLVLVAGGDDAWAGADLTWAEPAQVDAAPPFASRATIDDVSCPSASRCVAVDGGHGWVLSSSDPAGGEGAWRIEPGVFGDQDYGPTAISCPSISFCAAVSGGQVLVSSDPASPDAVWRGPSILPDATAYLTGISCPSASLCVAVDSAGRAWVSADPGGGAATWTPASVPEAAASGFADVACPSASLCVAVSGSQAVVSTDPAGGEWRAAVVDPDPFGFFSLTSIACPTTSLCVAGDYGGNVVSTTAPGDPFGWTVTHVHDASIDGVSCASASLCVAVSDTAAGGNVIASSDPAGGEGAWAAATIADVYALNAVACPSASLCVAANRYGQVVASSEPAGDGAAWSPARLGLNALTGVSCPSASFCAASDDAGNVLTSNAPSGGAAAWGRATISTSPLTGVSCASAELCLAIGDDGSLLRSEEPAGGAPAWHRVGRLSSERLNAISCPSATFCAVLASDGTLFTTADPGGSVSGWASPGRLGSTAAGLSCVSDSSCFAVGTAGLVAFDPAGDLSASAVAIDGLPNPRSISCPSSSLCIAGGAGGRVAVSSSPAEGQWSVAIAGRPAMTISGVSCTIALDCVAVDDSGEAIAGRPADALATAHVDAGDAVADLDGGFLVCGPVANPCATVQRGVERAASGGAVDVAAGRYREQITIGKQLTLAGAGAGQTVIEAPDRDSLITRAADGSKPVVLAHDAGGDGVSIRDLAVDGRRQGPGEGCDFDFTGIAYDNAGGAVERVTVTGVRGESLNLCHDNAIANSSRGAPVTWLVRNSSIEDYSLDGIRAIGPALDATIEGNTITAPDPVGWADPWGIHAGEGARVDVEGNTITGNRCGAPFCRFDEFAQLNAFGIALYDAAGGSRVADNTLSGNDVGAYVWIRDGGRSTVAGNTIGASRWQDLFFDEGKHAASANRLSGDVIGMSIGAIDSHGHDSEVTASGNTIGGAGTGIELVDQNPTDPEVPRLIAHDNRISGNSTAGIENTTPVVADAERNWWGCPGGPGAAGCDLVSGPVDFDPWLRADPDAPSPDPTPPAPDPVPPTPDPAPPAPDPAPPGPDSEPPAPDPAPPTPPKDVPPVPDPAPPPPDPGAAPGPPDAVPPAPAPVAGPELPLSGDHPIRSLTLQLRRRHRAFRGRLSATCGRERVTIYRGRRRVARGWTGAEGRFRVKLRRRRAAVLRLRRARFYAVVQRTGACTGARSAKTRRRRPRKARSHPRKETDPAGNRQSLRG